MKFSEDGNIKDQLLIQKTAATIFNEITKLQKSGKEIKNRLAERWVWELIQNAVDCSRDKGKIDIEISFNEQSILTFTHNGKGFTKKNIWALVTQTSNKQTDEKSIGQFGTGFVSTSLLSPIIKISSFLEVDNKSFTISLDRSGTTFEEIVNSVEENFDLLNNIFDNQPFSSNSEYVTTFSYNIKDSPHFDISQEAVQSGLISLKNHLPYLLCFCEEIGKITINDESFEVTRERKAKKFAKSVVKEIKNNNGNSNFLFQHFFEGGSFLAPISIFKDHDSFAQIPNEIARLNCKFPLIGTENFPFPIVLNSNIFEVEVDRDSIFESSDINARIIQTAMDEYFKLLDIYRLIANKDVNHICKIPHRQNSSFKINIHDKLEKGIFTRKIIEDSAGNLVTILDLDNNNKQVFIPTTEAKEYLQNIWELFSEVPNLIIPSFHSFENWRDIVSNEIGLSDVSNNHFVDGSISDFKESFGDGDAIGWLNKYYGLYSKTFPEEKIKKILVPNALGKFVEISLLHSVETIHSDLMEIYLSMFPDKKKYLFYQGIILPESLLKHTKRMTNENVAEKIENKILAIIAKDHEGERSLETKNLFDRILALFSNLGANAEIFFPTLYADRSKLRSKNFTEDLNKLGDLITDRNISIEQFQLLLTNQAFVDALNSNSVLSTELVNNLRHTTNHSIDSFEIINSLIERSIGNIFSFLKDNPLYELPNNLVEWKSNKLSKTVFKANKEGKSIFIVIRPSDDNKIIFYYDEEISVLGSHDYELWTDDGKEVREFTLGDLLETAKITMIPLENLYGGN